VVVVREAWIRGRGAAPSSTKQLNRAAELLARQVRIHWEKEANIRQLRDPQALTIRWSATERWFMDHPEVIGLAADNKAGGGLPEPRWLSLSGELDQVVQAFRKLPRRRLVVLGKPGAGKTGLLVMLTLGSPQAASRWRTRSRAALCLLLGPYPGGAPGMAAAATC